MVSAIASIMPAAVAESLLDFIIGGLVEMQAAVNIEDIATGEGFEWPSEVSPFREPTSYLPLSDRLMRVTMSSQACSSSAG